MITHGDVLDVLQGTPDEVYSGCFCDPPYGLSFMGKRWDHGVPSCEVWREVWRVLRPGAVLMAFGGTRTWHRLAVNIEDAGFEMFDTLMWIYGSGFPKSQDIGKAIDREAGQVGTWGDYKTPDHAIKRKPGNERMHDGYQRPWRDNPEIEDRNARQYEPATGAARTWQGYGTALKPAHEPVLLFRKPRRGTYAQTALQHGTGCLNIDGCRVETNGERPLVQSNRRNGNNTYGEGLCGSYHAGETTQGRWPANVVLDDEAGRLLDAQSGESGGGKFAHSGQRTMRNNPIYGKPNTTRHAPDNYGDTGGASRFFYCAKASRAEREAGLEGLPLRAELIGAAGHKTNPMTGRPVVDIPRANAHPCVKPLALTEYLARLIVPPVEYRDDARLLVPFCGSGSEILGALRAGWLHVDGIDNEAGYIEIAERRIAHELSKLEQFEQQLRLI